MNPLKLEALLRQCLEEDIGMGDLSAEAVFDSEQQGCLSLIAKQAGIFCGAPVIRNGFSLLDSRADIRLQVHDGEPVRPGQTLAQINGQIRALLGAERVVLNLIQRMSGIATATPAAVARINGSGANICDTRKTMPGLRMLDKYAVRCGGGHNHRRGLYDCIMLKDNHIAFAGSIAAAVAQARACAGHTIKIEVEVENQAMLQEAVAAGADIIMFDNCTPAQIRLWLPMVPPHISTEASGGITLDNLADYAASGVAWISLGALTHSVQALDISARVIPHFSAD